MGAFDLLAKAAKGAKKAAPFFSKADVVLDELQRNKGTGNEFLTEIIKKGAKPTELKERGIEKALKDKPKMTKAEVQKVFEEKAPPKVQEKVLTGEVPDYDEFLETKAQEEYGVDWFDLSKQERAKIEKMYMDLPVAQYGDYRTPGGKNYREILLKLPSRGLTDSERWELDLYNRDLKSAGKFLPEKQARYEELKAKEANPDYVSGHYKADPNLLAHIRVQDFIVNAPPEIRHVAINKNSGFPTQDFATQEELIEYIKTLPQNIQNSLVLKQAQVAKPSKKVLLVDEIQSDWHQAGRKEGYIDPSKKPYTIKKEDGIYRVRDLNGQLFDPFIDGQRQYGFMTAEAAENAMAGNLGRLPMTRGVPDAPFKKNWHELSMKRILDYAAENGYDSVAITPGAEQAKRYDLSKQVDHIDYRSSADGTFELGIADINGDAVNLPKTRYTAEELPSLVGKEIAEKMIKGEGQSGGGRMTLRGLDLQVGGEGMKGFYDKILPDYLNNYGKKYGAQMGEMDLVIKPESRGVNIMTPDEPEIYPAETMRFHSFDITPQMREEITTKGQPMYGKVAMPALEGLAVGTGAATIAPEVFNTDNEQQVQNPVHFTENPDAMLLELMQRN
jgi:hypothetical protein